MFVLPNGEEIVRVRKDSSSESEIDIMDGESNNNTGDWQSIVSNGVSRNIDNIPAPTQERQLENNIITADERYYHPNLFGKKDDKKYLKVNASKFRIPCIFFTLTILLKLKTFSD